MHVSHGFARLASFAFFFSSHSSHSSHVEQMFESSESCRANVRVMSSHPSHVDDNWFLTFCKNQKSKIIEVETFNFHLVKVKSQKSFVRSEKNFLREKFFSKKSILDGLA